MLKVSSILKSIFFFLCICNISNNVCGQIRLETFGGDDEPVVDVFWVKPIKENPSFLLLNRNKFWLPDYKSSNPRFSTLNIISYQLKKTGIGLAIAGTATNDEFQGRVGVQFLKVKPREWLFYTIASTKIGANGDVRNLLIAQYTPLVSERVRWFNRLEWISAFGYNDNHRFSQGILKEGIQIKNWQFGAGLEILWLGTSFRSIQRNWGVFIAREF